MERGSRSWVRQPLLQVRCSLVPGAAPTFAPDGRPVWSWTPGTLESASSGTRFGSWVSEAPSSKVTGWVVRLPFSHWPASCKACCPVPLKGRAQVLRLDFHVSNSSLRMKMPQ